MAKETAKSVPARLRRVNERNEIYKLHIRECKQRRPRCFSADENKLGMNFFSTDLRDLRAGSHC